MPLLDALGIWTVWFTAYILGEHYKLMENPINIVSLKGTGKY